MNTQLALTQLYRILAPLVILYIIVILWDIASYVIGSISLFGIGKRMGIPAYGLAWVPAANVWVVGAIADKYDERNGKDHKFRWVLVWIIVAVYVCLIAFVAMYTIDVISIINAVETSATAPAYFIDVFWGMFATVLPMTLASTALTVVEYICFYKIFELCKPDKPLKNLLIAILVPFAFPFVLLSCKKAFEAKEESSVPEIPEMKA